MTEQEKLHDKSLKEELDLIRKEREQWKKELEKGSITQEYYFEMMNELLKRHESLSSMIIQTSDRIKHSKG